jgi:magnesium-transporting ATPase (P-type)
MDKLQHKLTKENLKFRDTDKRSYNRKILTGSIVASFVAATPFLFYLYEYVPDTAQWDTILGTYNSNLYGSANVGIWVLMMKMIPLLLSLIWFFTCKHWWYHALLVPIVMFSFQIASAIKTDIAPMDESSHIVYLLPIMAFIFPSIYLIRAKMFNEINDADKTMEELEEEFMIRPKTIWGKVSQYF